MRPRNIRARKCIRWAGAVTFYLMAVFTLEYVLVLGHIQYLIQENEDKSNPEQHFPDKGEELRSLQPLLSPSVIPSPDPKSYLVPHLNSSVNVSNNQSKVIGNRTEEKGSARGQDVPRGAKDTIKNLKDPKLQLESVIQRKRLEEEAELEKTYYRLKPRRVNPYLYDFVLTPKSLCNDRTFMLILVHSFHPYTDRRRAIRSTWGSVAKGGSWPRRPLQNDTIRLAFVLGRHKDPGLDDLAKEEGEAYNDIIQGSFMDSYQNMTLKSLLGLRYFVQHCPQAKVLVKSDDDMVINIPYMVDVLHNNSMSRSIMGPLNRGARVYRTGKWKLPKDVFPFKYYPAYESGATYVIAGDLVKDLYETAEYVPPIFIDDVYITGILGKILNVTHVYQSGFAYWVDRAPTSCDINEDVKMTGTKMKPELLMRLWDELKRNVKNCPTPPPKRVKAAKKAIRTPKRVDNQH